MIIYIYLNKNISSLPSSFEVLSFLYLRKIPKSKGSKKIWKCRKSIKKTKNGYPPFWISPEFCRGELNPPEILHRLCISRNPSVSAAPQSEPLEMEVAGELGNEAQSGEMMAAERVMGVDEGKDAFHDMEAAVKSAGERVAGVNKELESALRAAVRRFV